ncbi:MAG: RluA family pseudouridine synthase [Chlorobi bacterium]|nr:RluA family pseudouridine synthase [Chlorobiota bacterium]
MQEETTSLPPDRDDLYEHHRFEVPPGQSPVRIDRYLTDKIENVSRNKIQNAIKAGNVVVNEKPVKANYKVRPGDVIRILLPYAPYRELLKPEPIPLDIVYEDEDVIVVNKSAGMVVHPAPGHYSGTLINGLIYHVENLPGQNERPGLVHRIDKDTSGLLVVAKNELAMNKLAKQFAEKSTERKYIALVWGDLPQDEGTITGHIGRHPKHRIKMHVFPEGEQGKPAVTHYKVLERYGYATLVEAQLETGRTHQIRAHFKHIGHPLFNDALYGGDKIMKGSTFAKFKQFVENTFKVLPRQALHAKTLGFIHPSTGRFLRFDSELPDDFRAAIDRWRRYTGQAGSAEV